MSNWSLWGVLAAIPATTVLWQFVPESHTPLVVFALVMVVAMIAYACELDARDADAYWDEQVRKAEAERRKAEEEREARMAAYKAVALLAEQGIAVYLPEEQETLGKEDHA